MVTKGGGWEACEDQKIFRKREHTMVIFANTSDDSRPSTEHQLSVCPVLPPKGFNSDSAGILWFRLGLGFPDEVDGVQVLDAVHEECRSLPVTRDGARLGVHGSAPYMTKVADRLQAEGF